MQTKPYVVEPITGDNRRPGMKHQEGFLVRYRPHEQFGWLCCRTFTTRSDAEQFASELDATGNLADGNF